MEINILEWIGVGTLLIMVASWCLFLIAEHIREKRERITTREIMIERTKTINGKMNKHRMDNLNKNMNEKQQGPKW